MNSKITLATFFLASTLGMVGCNKKSDDPIPATFEPVTFKFGSESTAVTISNPSQQVKNLPRSCDVTNMAASVALPAGYSITPDPSALKDYTKGVTFTITNAGGGTYTVQIFAPAYHSVDNPYGIYNVKQLSDIRFGLNDSYVLMNDIVMPELSAANAAATTGISDYAGHGWFSIGATYVNGGHVIFRGSLDGQNHTIKNFVSIYRGNNPNPDGIDPARNGKNTDGLFGYAIGATFKNIHIQPGTAGIADFTPDGAYGNVGALVGLADSSNISNCRVTGTSLITGGQYTGGLIGKAMNSQVAKCYVTLTPATGSYALITGGDGGGLIGSVFGSQVSDSYASGSLMGAGTIGGLIGSANTTNVNSCFASVAVTETPFNTAASLIAPNSLGGLIGLVTSNTATVIQNCYATGSVSGANGTNTDFHKGTRIGGLIGSIGNSPVLKVNFCYANGAVSRIWTNASSPFLIGGLVGTTANNVFITSSLCTSYWDKSTTGQDFLGGGNASLAPDNGHTANAESTADMKLASTYVNWDFSAIWVISAGTNNGYPTLRSINK